VQHHVKGERPTIAETDQDEVPCLEAIEVQLLLEQWREMPRRAIQRCPLGGYVDRITGLPVDWIESIENCEGGPGHGWCPTLRDRCQRRRGSIAVVQQDNQRFR
jgi:hypothetical protein